MLNIDSWIRFALTEIYAVLLLAFIFQKKQTEEKRKRAALNLWSKAEEMSAGLFSRHLPSLNSISFP